MKPYILSIYSNLDAVVLKNVGKIPTNCQQVCGCFKRMVSGYIYVQIFKVSNHCSQSFDVDEFFLYRWLLILHVKETK